MNKKKIAAYAAAALVGGLLVFSQGTNVIDAAKIAFSDGGLVKLCEQLAKTEAPAVEQ